MSYNKLKNNERVIVDNRTLAMEDNSPKIYYRKEETKLKVLMDTRERDKNLICTQYNLLRCSIKHYL